MDSKRYAAESQFWETAGSLLKKGNEEELPFLFDSLSERALTLNLPITFSGVRSDAWALICRIFVLYQDRMSFLGRKEYRAMISGTKRIINANFASTAFKRIAANITYPSSPGRTMRESVADTFLANGLTVTEGYKGPAMDDVILSESLADREMMDICNRVVTPPPGLWEEAEHTYPSFRPGPMARQFLKIYFWIFNQ
ncbi:MAG: hypothetical protein PHU03_02020 [Syntrophales bacterium]|nr:hypothetical protein [Syntrophales bacterium]